MKWTKLSMHFFLLIFFLFADPQVSFGLSAITDLPTNSVVASSAEPSSQTVEPVTALADGQAAAIVENTETEKVESHQASPSEEIVGQAWVASGKNDLSALSGLVNNCLELYENEANLLQQQLSGFPPRNEIKNYQILNDVATCLFIEAEALMNNGQRDKAIAKFQDLIKKYPWAQAWDPHGWYWSVAEKSQASIDVLTGKAQEELEKNIIRPVRTKPFIFTKGRDIVVEYTKYGKFLNVGTEKYHYSITDVAGLSAAVGEGIYPNTGAVYDNPRYKELKKLKKLEGSHWDYVNTDDLEAAFFKWVTAKEPWGVRLFYIGTIFERAGMYHEALRAYHSLVVHYPKTVAKTYWQTPWYPGQAAIAKIRYILRMHPELNLIDKWMKIEVKNAFDNDADNDVISTYPGKIVSKGMMDKMKETLQLKATVNLGSVKNTIGAGEVQLVQYSNGHWQMMVQGKPYKIYGITYAPTRIGETPHKGTLKNWMEQDENNNGKIDGPYDSWVDKNRNDIQDADEPTVGDFQLMKEMGVNTLRIYHHPLKPNKELLRKMYNEYGFRVIMGDFLGKYAIGSGAAWNEGTDYENSEHKKKMMESVQEMVMEYKDEPYILLWVLGNENNYGLACNADKKPEAYFKFVDEVTQWIKSVDKNHPVAVSNGEILFLDIFAKNAPNVDIFSGNFYRGDYGFGSLWDQLAEITGKPVFLTEYGSPSYAHHLTIEEGEIAQAQYHKGNWIDIEDNMAGSPRGAGNALGGIVFEWLDEWWKNHEPFLHDRKSDANGPFPGGYYFEEWFGIVGQGKGAHSPFLRQLKKTYFMYKELWTL